MQCIRRRKNLKVNHNEVKKVDLVVKMIGLRNLSLKVKDIVIEMRSTSYKDVAERLI